VSLGVEGLRRARPEGGMQINHQGNRMSWSCGPEAAWSNSFRLWNGGLRGWSRVVELFPSMGWVGAAAAAITEPGMGARATCADTHSDHGRLVMRKSTEPIADWSVPLTNRIAWTT
jgi:hypothetical protein